MFKETETIWNYLKTVKKPIVMYGMGDGAEKILKVMNSLLIVPDAFMASDEFVRGQSFCGYKVKTLNEIENAYKDFIIVICFGTHKEDVIDKIYKLSEKYEVYAPDVPVIGDGLFNEQYLAENIEKIVTVREMLADDISKETLDKWIDFRISGKIALLKEFTTPHEEALDLLSIKADGKETFVDLGAYDGDTVELFLAKTQKNFNTIIAVEPDSRNYQKLRRRNYALGSAKFKAINAAAWSEDTKIEFSNRGGRNSSLSSSRRTRSIDARSVDSICKDEKPTIIKMDVEGSEQAVLLGAKKTIKTHRPRLIVSLYHRNEDMIELPLLIQKISDGKYKMYLRHHNSIPAWDTNLYCV